MMAAFAEYMDDSDSEYEDSSNIIKMDVDSTHWTLLNEDKFYLCQNLLEKGIIDQNKYQNIELDSVNKLIKADSGDNSVENLIASWNSFPFLPGNDIVQFLKTVPSGQTFLEQIKSECFNISNNETAYGLVLIKQDNLIVVATNDEGVSKIKEKINREIRSSSFEKEENINFIKEAKSLKESKKDICLMKVEVKQGKVEFVIVGLEQNARELEDTIHRVANEMMVKSHSVNLGPSYNLLNKFHMKEIKEKLKPFNLAECIKMDDNSKAIFLEGHPLETAQAEKNIMDLVSQVKTKREILTLNALSKELLCQNDFVKDFETTNQVLMKFEESNDISNNGGGGAMGDGSSVDGGASNIKVVQGNIVDQVSDVLVNVFYGRQKGDKLKGMGAISKVFCEKGGPELKKELLSIGVPQANDKSVIETSPHQITNAKTIYHFYVRKDGDGYQRMSEAVHHCLVRAQASGYKTLTLPTVGCGKLRMDEKKVARKLMEAHERFKKEKGDVVEMKVCAFESATAKAFEQFFASPTKLPSVSSNEKDVTSSSLVVSISYLEGHHDSRKDVDLKHQIEISFPLLRLDHKVPEILFFDVKSQLSSLKNQHGFEFEFLKTELMVRAYNTDKYIVENGVRRILRSVEEKSKDREYMKGILDIKDYYCYLKTYDIHEPPKYWNATKMPGNYDEIELSSSDQIYKDVEKLMRDTMNTTVIGAGNDAKGISYTDFEIRKIYLVRNKINWTKYNFNQIEYSGNYNQKPFPTLLNATKKEASTYELKTKLNEHLESELNERYLFHGTKIDVVHKIQRGGIDIRKGSDRVLFGKGAYFAESFTKADQYSDGKDKREPNGTELCMFLCRVMMGEIYLSEGTYTHKLPPCRKCSEMQCSAHYETFDSVIGTHKTDTNNSNNKIALNFREFVVFETNHSYPEFKIKYIRK